MNEMCWTSIMHKGKDKCIQNVGTETSLKQTNWKYSG